ncbi:hypothetical protein VIGAN_03040200 [Vigna angularis var. angularis]|uniref:Uncharacterized protein n=1 Tax=Vigna angularis var. angularis TaxID=157739 RepID=A0A0S3RJM3_PHAAN|nr:hypothetical protein VIGAN_03040200 [Vigna angularis var. angularis]
MEIQSLKLKIKRNLKSPPKGRRKMESQNVIALLTILLLILMSFLSCMLLHFIANSLKQTPSIQPLFSNSCPPRLLVFSSIPVALKTFSSKCCLAVPAEMRWGPPLFVFFFNLPCAC